MALLAIVSGLQLTASAQVRAVYDRGAAGLLQLLKRLNTSASVLMIGAHPDDEDTALLAYLARGENARTAYLSLTRGDGGQNIIGRELGESLGVIRTEELLQARRLDGAEQFFTRAYDYGFSKTLDEAKRKWDEKLILCDAVKVIRHFRPLVVVSQFAGTPADNHGQHQFAGYITPLAVRAAGDAMQCSEAGPAWTVRKFYVRHRPPGDPRLRVNTGRYDPVLGRSYFEIAMEARSQHKSQEQGVLELRGDQVSSLNLQGSEARESGIFEGIETTLAAAGGAELQPVVDAARKSFEPDAPSRILADLAKGYSISQRLAESQPSARSFFDHKKKQFTEAIELAGGLQIDALADTETVAAGESLLVGAKVFTAYKDLISVRDLSVVAPATWAVTKVEPPRANSAASTTREVAHGNAFFTISIPRDQRPSQPYWLIEPRDGDMFNWAKGRMPEAHTLPVQQYYPRVAARLVVAGTEVVIEKPVEFRFADDVRGEIRRNIDVVPNLSVEMDQALMIVPQSNKVQTRRVVMTVTNHSRQPVNGVLTLNAGPAAAWKYSASTTTFNLTRTGEKTAVAFDIAIPAGTRAGSYPITGAAMVGEAQANMTMRTIAYPHIQTHRFYRRASVDALVIDLKTADVKVGYIAGSGDRVPDAIAQMGFDLEMISEAELAGGDLSRYNTIVVGIRAYQVRPDVVANNKRLLDFARAGGTLIVQYQLPAYAQQNLTPFPTAMGPRTADENAPIKMLFPDHPILNFPNKITDADFMGWVQERNLYNFNNYGPEYTGLLESHDAGEAENSGGLVLARIGKGNYIYCSYSLFRQLPAGVPGAYRLLANLVSLGRGNRSRQGVDRD